MPIISTSEFNSVADFTVQIEGLHSDKHTVYLYRGQGPDEPLLPKLFRDKTSKPVQPRTEKAMLDEFAAYLFAISGIRLSTYWEKMVYAQHFGVSTRFLDWTSNPLVALWFACCSPEQTKGNSVVWMAMGSTGLLADTKKSTPFDQPYSKFVKPLLNNKRILAQGGWFSVHKWSKGAGRYVALDKNTTISDRLGLHKLVFPHGDKGHILKQLDNFGINHLTMFGDDEGIARYINFRHLST